MMSRSARCRRLRSRNCRSTSDGCAGAFPGRLRSVAISTTTSRLRIPRRSGVGSRKYNYRTIDLRLPESEENPFVDAITSSVGTDWPTYRQQGPGVSAFVLQDGVVYHTYSSYERGLDGPWACTSGLTGCHRSQRERVLWCRLRRVSRSLRAMQPIELPGGRDEASASALAGRPIHPPGGSATRRYWGGTEGPSSLQRREGAHRWRQTASTRRRTRRPSSPGIGTGGSTGSKDFSEAAHARNKERNGVQP